MQTGWRLERTYFAGAGFNESRLEGLDINWSEPMEPTGHAALWADNGTGKTTITALRFALYLPDTRDFIRGDSDRSLAKLVRSNEVCHVVEQATRVANGEVQRIVVGLMAAWADGTQDLDNPSRLERLYYGWVTGEDGPTIDDLHFRAPTARWATSIQFLDTLRGVMPSGGALPPHKAEKSHKGWRNWLIAAGVDLEQVRFQTVMNASEGGVDRVMRFRDSDAFAAWLIGAITPTSTVDQIGKSIDVLRTNAAARPRWTDELELWQRLIHPMLGLAVAYEDVTARRRALSATEANAGAIVADADATIAGLRQDHATATEQLEYYEQRRKDAGALLRRAQAHRLRMQHRAVHLRADEAEAVAGELLHVRDAASEKLAAWRLVANVLAARVATSQLAGLTERLAAAERETADLQRAEQQHRNALARLLTERREQASAHLAAGKREQAAAEKALTKADEELASALGERATTEAKTQRAEAESAEAEQVLIAAIESGLIDEDDDPTAVDEAIKQVITDSRAARQTAIGALRGLNLRTIAAQKAESDARRKAATAREDANRVAGLLREADDRTESLAQNRYVIDALGGNAAIDLWQQRHSLADALKTHAASADSNADQARSQIAAAKRIRSSIGADGLLPAPTAVEEAARRCRENADLEIPAWPGWRWLADTMTPQAAAEFALARPDIVSGVVVAHPDLVDDAVAAIGDLAIDSALWVGAVHDSTAARDSLAAEGTRAQVLLPPSGMYDRDSASRMLAAADQQLADATDLLDTAQSQAVSIRETLASLNRLWTELPDDPRPGYAQQLETANSRRAEAETAEANATALLVDLARLQREHENERDAAQALLDEAADKRPLLVPVIAAHTTRTRTRQELPGLRGARAEARRRVDTLNGDRPRLVAAVTATSLEVAARTRKLENAAEALRSSRLSPNAAGPVPVEDEDVLRARWDSVVEALTAAAVDPELQDSIIETRQRLSDLDAILDADPARRRLAEELSETDAARHAVALTAAVKAADEDEARAREEYARARAAADQATATFRSQKMDAADRSSPDADGVPAAFSVTDPDDADRYAARLDELASEQLEAQRIATGRESQEREKTQKLDIALRLVDASVKQLRSQRDESLSGRRWSDPDELINRITDIAGQLQEHGKAVTTSEQAQQAAAGAVRAHANGVHARRVEDAGDVRVTDLLTRLRADERLPADAERLAEQLEQRATSLRDDLDHHDANVRTCAKMLHVQAATAIDRLRSYQNQSRLPDGLGDWSQRHFVTIDHEPLPTDESVAVDRVARVVHALLSGKTTKSDAQALLFAAARALVDAPFRVRILKPHIDLSLDRVDVGDLKNFSGGQRVTAGVLLYATMTRVRASGDATSIGWLWLDNPFGQASADQFIRTMRRAADQLGLQLLFTAAPKDKSALSMFDRVITLARRHRPSSKENVIVLSDGAQELVDLTLIQRDVTAVLGG